MQVLCFEEGLQVDPFCWDLKAGLEKASQGVFEDLLTGACTWLADTRNGWHGFASKQNTIT